MKKCILCNSAKVKIIQAIDSEQIYNLYNVNFNINISAEISNFNKINCYKCENCKLIFFNPDLAGSPEFYEDLQLKRKVYYSPDRAEFNYALKFINKEDSVLEIGSGSGSFASKIKPDKYIGLEYNDQAILKAKEKGVTLIKQSIEEFSKVSQNEFDVVCSFHVLEHVKNPNEFIKASISKLKPFGKLILAVPCNNSALTSNHNHVLNLPPHHITRWNIETMQSLAELFNLNIIEYKVLSIGSEINKNNYFKSMVLNKSLAILYPNNRIVIDPKKFNKINWITSRLINKLRLYKFSNEDKFLGENMTFVFQKKA